MNRVIKEIIAHFQDDDAMDRIQEFAEHGRQVEAWFKGELIRLFAKSNFINEAYSEVSHPRNNRLKYDFVLRTTQRGRFTGMEVKTAFVGRQYRRRFSPDTNEVVTENGQRWNLNYVITEGHNGKGGLVRDAHRLCDANDFSRRFCLIFAYGDASSLTRDCVRGFIQRFKERLAGNDLPIGVRLHNERLVFRCPAKPFRVLPVELLSK
jgi:hypothetical protein